MSEKENNEKKKLKSNLKNLNKNSDGNKKEVINNNENNDIHLTEVSETVLIDDKKRDLKKEDDTQRLFENSFNESQSIIININNNLDKSLISIIYVDKNENNLYVGTHMEV